MFREKSTFINSSEPEVKVGYDKHFKVGMYNDLLSFLYSQSIGYDEAFIMDPYFCKRSLEVVRDFILRYRNFSNVPPSFKILKCAGNNHDNEDSAIPKGISETECLKIENIQVFSTLANKTFHSRYLIFRKNDTEKGDAGVKIFVLSDSYYKVRESELDIVYQTDYEPAYTTISRYETDHCMPDTNKQIYPRRQNAK